MGRGLIDWSLRHRIGVLLAIGALSLAALGLLQSLKLDAIPDLSEVQVIVQAGYAGASPQAVEDQITYPLATALLSTPAISSVRGFSMFGQSFIYVIFRDGTDPSWARARVLESLSQAAAHLPAGVAPTLGPDASGVGWVFEYALVDRHHRYNPDELRSLQDFFLALELQSVAGVAEVASVGGMARQFQIELDPLRLAANGLSLGRVVQAVGDANITSGGGSIEMGRAEYMVRAPGYLRTPDDFQDIPLGRDSRGERLRLGDVARIQIGAEARIGVTDLDGAGDAPGGIVVMRRGENALAVAEAVRARLDVLRRSLPAGVEIAITYDRAGLIRGAVGTLYRKLLEESLAVAVVCVLFLRHLRSALVILVTLPLGILAALALLSAQGVSANIMSLGGIAIAIGTMVDAVIVMVENLHKHLEHRGAPADHWQCVQASASEVGPALFFSLLVITVSFVPVFALTGQEGRLFRPLALTKTYAVAASALLAVTLTPVLMGYLVRGAVRPERASDAIRLMQRAYRRALAWVLRHAGLSVCAAVLALGSLLWPLSRLGTEFMPPLFEGSVLYMPTTLPALSIDEAGRVLQVTDRLLRQLPEVAEVYGKAGRAQTATDPAPLTMFETLVTLKPRDQWPAGESYEQLLRRMDAQVQLPGITNGWGYPIRTRIDMLASGIRTPLGIKVSGSRLEDITRFAGEIEQSLRRVQGTRAVFADRPGAGRFVSIELDRRRAAALGVSTADLQLLVGSGIGGEPIATVLSGRERYSVSMRYARAWRDHPQAMQNIPIVTQEGEVVRLGDVARIAVRDGPAEIKSENARLTAYIYLDLDTRDLTGYVKRADQALATLTPPAGTTYAWSGQYAQIEHARARLAWLIPLTAVLAAWLLYLHFRNWTRVALVLLTLPFALIGGVWLIYLLGYPLSVAVVVGFIALGGVALEFGVVMLLYLDQAHAAALARDARLSAFGHYRALFRGASSRVRPKAMTVSVILAGLIPVMFGDGIGNDVMKRIAAPLVGGMLTAPLLSLLLVPVLYDRWQRRAWHSPGRSFI